MMVLGPALCLTDRPGAIGMLARYCVVVPYAALAMLLAQSR
jgi:hypothetical protein